MLTLQRSIAKRVKDLVIPFCLAMAFYAGSTTQTRAQAPPNDNLANAQAIVGSSGIVYGNNLNATAETNEPAPYINPPQATIWYLWTAPITTTMDFSTRYSTDPNGNELGTVMAVYSVNGGLAYSNLTLLASNEYDPSSGVTNGDVTSRVDFPVTMGTVYLIQVDGSTNTPTGVADEGYIQLNWGPSLVGGTFSFTSSTYYAGEYDDTLYLGYQPDSLDPSLHNPSGDANIRITVARQGGYTGRCEVTLVVTNTVYTNLLETNFSATNIYITNYDTNMVFQNSTNIFFTNIASVNYISNLTTAGLIGIPVYHLETAAQTNVSGVPNAKPTIINPASLAGLGFGNFFTNFNLQNYSVTNGPVTNGDVVTIVVTQYFVTNIVTNSVIESASNGLDYVPMTTNLVFNDFQMSQDVYLQINPGDAALTGPDWITKGPQLYYGINPVVTMTLTNAVLDPYEDPDITPPTISGAGSNATLTILNFSGNPNPAGTNTDKSGFVTINLERVAARVNKGAAGTTNNAYIYAILTGNPGLGNSYIVHYTIDCAGVTGSTVGTPNSSFNDNRFPTVAGSDYAQPGYYNVTDADFGNPLSDPPDPSDNNVGGNTQFGTGPAYVGTITFGPYNDNGAAPLGEIAIPIYNPGGTEFDVDMNVQIFTTLSDIQANTNQTVPGVIGNISSANLTINFSGPPGGTYDTSFNPAGSATLSYPPKNANPGANPPPLDGGVVQAVAMQPNGQAVIGGYFTSYNTTPVYSIARLLTNGWLDTSFNNVLDGGVNGFVTAIVIDSSGRIIVGGDFSSYDGNLAPANNIVRLNPNGTVDSTFNTGIGFNSSVYALAIDASGNILVGGDFTSYNTVNCNHIARLLANGALDASFLPNTGNGRTNYGTDQDVNTIATDANGNIIMGGDFNYVNGVNLNYLARLLPSGAVDTSFAPTVGPDDSVYSVAIETNNNNEIIIGGAFQNYNSLSSPGVALVTYNGALDTTFPIGAGADGDVYSVVLQPNGEVLVGGQFRNFNTTRRLGVCRLLTNGWVDTGFMDTAYNQYAGLINSYYNQSVEPVHAAYALAVQPDGNIVVGGSFTNIGGGSARDAINSQINVTRLIGASTAGPMTGGGGIGNCPGNITLTQNPYTVNDTAGKFFVTLDRVNGSLGPAQVTLGTNTYAPGSGSATAADFGLILPSMPLYNDIYPFWDILPYGNYGWRESDGYYGNNTATQPSFSDQGDSALNMNIYDDTSAQQNLLASLSLLDVTELNITNNGGTPVSASPLILGGVVVPTYPALGLPSANLEIINNNFPVGYVGFSATNYTAINTSNTVTITVLRTNGDSGPIKVAYFTANGTALAGSNYTAISLAQNKTLEFLGGPNNNSATFTIPILDTSTFQSNKFFKIFLTNASPTGALYTNAQPILSSTATVTIIDGNFTPGHLTFSSPTYSVLKPGVASIGVARVGGATGQLTVQCGTSDGTAVNGVNYTGVTNTLSWGDQDISVKTMNVQTLQDNVVDGSLLVNLSLFNATNIGNTNNDNLILYAPTNATLTIVESDSYGSLNFAAPVSDGVPNFNVLQNAGQALITVVRSGGTTGALTVNYATANDTNPPATFSTALAGTNYGETNGVLVFPSGVTSTNFVVPIYYTPGESTPANRMVLLMLTNGSPTNISSQFPVYATLTIVDPQLVYSPAGSVDTTTLNGTGFNGYVNSLDLQPDGEILAAGNFTSFDHYPFEYVSRLQTDGAFDSSFLLDQAGANSEVYQVLSQTTTADQTNNGPIIAVGDFTSFDGVARNGMARLNINGSLDETFNPGSGADSTIFTVAETLLPTGAPNQTNLAYYIGGNFANFDSVACGGIARINGSSNSPGYEGAVDTTFSVGQGVTSASGAVKALAVQADNSVIAGGDFTAFNSLPYNHLVRLNSAGVVDPTFNVGTGSSSADSVDAIAIQPNGQILIGGSFTNVIVSNVTYNFNYLARLNIDGSVDTNFNVGYGGNNSVLAIAVDSQQRIVVGGAFSTFSGVTRSGITRLNPDGTVDPTINFEGGAEGGYVDTLALQSNDEIDAGGGFSSFEGIAENNFVRLYGGANSGNGSIEFSQASFGVLQNATNAVVTLQRLGGEGASNVTVSIVFSTSDGTAVAGNNYTAVTTNVIFPLGETFVSVLVPVNNTSFVGSNTFLNLNLSNPTNTVIGLQASATLIITNLNTAVEFSAPTYRDSANVPGGYAIIPVQRIGDPNTTLAVTVYTGTLGSAIPNVNYLPQTNVLTFNPGVTNLDFNVPLLNPTNVFSDVTVDVELSNPSNTIVTNVSAAPSNSAILTIAHVYNSPGVLSFSQPSYSVVENATNALITVVRTNGSSGLVSVTLTTSNGTAIAGTNYLPLQATLSFADGQVSQSTNIPVIQQTNATSNLTVYLTLSNPQPTTGGPSIGGPTQEILTIINDIENFSFAQSTYSVLEGNMLSVYVNRAGVVTNTASVTYYTANGTAQSNVDYVPVSGVLTFGPNVTQQSIPIQIPQGTVVNGPLTFSVILTNPVVSNSLAFAQIATPGTNTVTIVNDLTAFELSSSSYAVSASSTNLLVTVSRINTTNPAASVQFATGNGASTNAAINAVSGVDYVSTNGTLNFAAGQTTATFSIQILSNNIVESNKSFTIALSNPLVNSGTAYLTSPANATVSITNDVTGVNFGSPAYFASDCLTAAAVIPVVLTGATNNAVNVAFSTANGTATAGSTYFATNGILHFAPGQTSSNITVQLINNHLTGANLTVLLALSNVQNALLLSPSNTVLTIQECNGFTNFIVTPGASSAFFSWNTPALAMVQVAYGLTPSYGSVTSVSGPSTNHVVLLSGLQRDTTYYFNAIAWEDGTVYTTNGSFSTVDTIILNTVQANYSGSWSQGAGVTGYYGSYFNDANTTTGNPTASATYTPSIQTPGLYNVYTWYPQYTNFSLNTQMYVSGAANEVIDSVNQTINGSTWFQLATNLYFASGNGGNVAVLNDTGETGREIAANAMKWSYASNQDYTAGSVPIWWNSFYSLPTNSAASNYDAYVFGLPPGTQPGASNFWATPPTNHIVTAYFTPYQGGRIYQIQTSTNLTKGWSSLTNLPVISTNTFTNAYGNFTNGSAYGVFTFTLTNNVQTYIRLSARLSTNY